MSGSSMLRSRSVTRSETAARTAAAVVSAGSKANRCRTPSPSAPSHCVWGMPRSGSLGRSRSTTSTLLAATSALIRDRVSGGRLTLAGAVYDIETGGLEWVRGPSGVVVA